MGKIEPSGDITVTHGSEFTFEFSAVLGNSILGLFVDNVNVPVSDNKYDTYTFNSIVGNHTIHVEFSNVGIVETRHTSSLRIYPNPTNSQLRIENYELEMGDIEIYDVVGRKAPLSPPEGGKLPSFGGAGGGVIDISHLANGLYFLKIGNTTVKVIKN